MKDCKSSSAVSSMLSNSQSQYCQIRVYGLDTCYDWTTRGRTLDLRQGRSTYLEVHRIHYTAGFCQWRWCCRMTGVGGEPKRSPTGGAEWEGHTLEFLPPLRVDWPEKVRVTSCSGVEGDLDVSDCSEPFSTMLSVSTFCRVGERQRFRRTGEQAGELRLELLAVLERDRRRQWTLFTDSCDTFTQLLTFIK